MSFPAPYKSFGETKHLVLEWKAEGVLQAGMNRPPVNSVTESVWREWAAFWQHIKYDQDVGVVILCGEGRCFTAGLDLTDDGLNKAMDGTSDVARKGFLMRRWLLEFQDAITAMERCDKPVIAAVHNVAYGAGIDIMSACDIRYAERGARFSIKEVDAGLAADIGTLQRFPKIVGNESAARELAFTGREFGAEEALQIGFISKVVDGGREGVLAAALELAKNLAAKGPIALRGTKHIMLHTRDHSVQDGLEYVAAWNMAMLQSDEIPESMVAILQKKQPKFAKL